MEGIMTEHHKPDETPFAADDNITHDLREAAQEAVRQFQAQSARRTGDSGVFHTNMHLMVRIVGQESELTVPIQGEVVIGRYDSSTDYRPELDLSEHAAYQLGVSRKHAILRREGKNLHIVDLGSRNGTYLNGKRLDPQAPHAIHHGDELQIGKITLKLTFKYVPSAS